MADVKLSEKEREALGVCAAREPDDQITSRELRIREWSPDPFAKLVAMGLLHFEQIGPNVLSFSPTPAGRALLEAEEG